MKFDDFEQTQQHISPFMEQIDEVCDDFEAAWQRGSRIRIENCLRLVPDAAREELLRELLEIEVELRVRDGESVLFEQYAARFPDHLEIVKWVLQRHTGRRRLGDYELLEQLGRGGMGVVYKARQVYLNQIVAIKILPEQYVGDSHALSRFRREMQLIGGLKHQNIVQAYNAGEADGMHYLVMEYVAGVTLQRLIAEMVNRQADEQSGGQDKAQSVAEHEGQSASPVTLPHLPTDYDDVAPTELDRSGIQPSERTANNLTVPDPARTIPAVSKPTDGGTPGETSNEPEPPRFRAMSVGAACEAIRQAALGLHHAHQRGLVHRDIKPGNLMLERHGVIKVLDLGLGKFQADVMQGEHSMGPLTQAGTTMGTVDYMAPEQWDDPTTVDIRADIYSLGNTLYFLLCGSPPFDGKNYGSNRAKLMAHIVAEPPSLRKACPDVPPELEQVYLKMVAKEPQDRYQTPIEAVEALEPFADMEALHSCIPRELKRISDADQSTSSEYDNSVGRDTIASYPYTPSRRRKMTELAPPPKPWYRHQEFYAFVALFNLVLLVVAIWLVSRLWRDDQIAQPPDGTHVATPDFETLRYDATARNAISADLVELPGLSGATWFSEMPWFLPFVRQETAAALSQTTEPETVLGKNMRGYLDPDTVNVQQWLWRLADKTRENLTPPQRRLVEDLKTLADSNLDGDAYAGQVEAALARYVEGGKNLPHRAVDSNAEAVLMHILSGLKGDKAMAEQARKKYQEALDAYGDDRISQQLKLLCMTDMARLLAGTLNEYDVAKATYDKVLGSDATTNLLKVEVRTSLGMDAAGTGQYADYNFNIARQLLTDPKAVNIGGSHPLLAHVYERHAWSLIDQWKVNEAHKLFNDALSIREANKREGHNPFADIYVLHNRHGLAMTARFRGDPETARKEYEAVIRDINAKLTADEEKSKASPEKPLPGQLRYFRELRERLANSRYRRADCELFGGAASDPGGVNLARAEQLYDIAMRTTNDRATAVTLLVKLSMVRALLGKIEEANAGLRELDTDINRIMSENARFRARQSVETMQQIINIRAAELAVGANAATPESLANYEQEIARFRAQLLKFAEDMTLGAQGGASPGPTQQRYNHDRPDSLEFRLFCVEFLINAEKKCQQLSGGNTLSKASDLLLLGGTLNVFKDRPEMMPYARRYYDLALQVADRSNLSTLALMMQVKMGAPPDYAVGNDVGEAWQLLFQFAPGGNFVILKRDGTQPAIFQPINLTREQIKEAANLGQNIDPQPELAEILSLVREARETKRIVNIYWDDSRCWADEKFALIDEDWPFKNLLPLRVAPAAEQNAALIPVYFGTYTNDSDGAKGVYLAKLDTQTGKLTEAELAAEVPSPTFLARHPNQPRLYAVTEQGQGTGGSPVHAFAVDPGTFALAKLNEQAVPALGACHLDVFALPNDAAASDTKAQGENVKSAVFVACYHEGATASLPLSPDGLLKPCATIARHRGSGPTPRQTQAHAHAVYEWEPGLVVVPDLGVDKLFFYRVKPDGTFVPDPQCSEISVPPGSGPRHIAFSRATRTAFVLNELNSTINVVAYAPTDSPNAVPQIMQTISTLPEGRSAENNFPAEIFPHPNGRFLYASNRGDDSIALFLFDEASRRLAFVETFPCGGKGPRSFALSPDGQWLIVAAMQSDLVTTFRVNPDDGRLTPTGHAIPVKQPACVLPVEM